MAFRELSQEEYDRKLRLVAVGAEGLHPRGQYVNNDGKATNRKKEKPDKPPTSAVWTAMRACASAFIFFQTACSMQMRAATPMSESRSPDGKGAMARDAGPGLTQGSFAPKPKADSGGDGELRIKVFPREELWVFSVIAIDDSTYEIKVIDGEGRGVQTIGDLASRQPFTTKELLDIRDYNADGYPDILARTLPVAASAISGGVLYMFVPATRKFVEADGIEQEGDVALESKGCISVQYRGDAMNYRKDHYCWETSRWKFQQTTED